MLRSLVFENNITFLCGVLMMIIAVSLGSIRDQSLWLLETTMNLFQSLFMKRVWTSATHYSLVCHVLFPPNHMA